MFSIKVFWGNKLGKHESSATTFQLTTYPYRSEQTFRRTHDCFRCSKALLKSWNCRTRPSAWSFVFVPCHLFVGITKARLIKIRKDLTFHGSVQEDKRGKNSSIHRKLKTDVADAVFAHIKSLKGWKSHCSLENSRKTYLPEELNVAKLYKMFKEKYPDTQVSCKSYRKIFSENFNISFGYPRSDTCSTCNE